MSKYDTIIDSVDPIENSDESSLDDEMFYMGPEEFKQNQMDEYYEVRSNLYDFLKTYMGSKEYVFPIMENFNFRNFSNFLDKFIVPNKLN